MNPHTLKSQHFGPNTETIYAQVLSNSGARLFDGGKIPYRRLSTIGHL